MMTRWSILLNTLFWFSSSGRTQKQVLDYVKEGGHKKVQFER